MDVAEGRGSRLALAALPAVIAYTLLTLLNIALHASTTNADFWVRLASGRLVVQNHVIPRHDPFTFTVRGEPWIDHEWLLGSAMYALNNVSYELLVVVAALVGLLPFLVLHRMLAKERGNNWLLLALIVFAALVAWRSYAIRPQLVNPVLFVALIWLIDDRRRTGSSLIWLAVPLTLVWANLQAGFLVSLAVLAAWAGLSLIERRERFVPFAVLAAAAVTPLLNAYGPELYSYALTASASGNVDRAVIPEWRSPDFHDFLNLPTLAGMLLLAYVGVRSEDRFRQVLVLGTLAANLLSARFVPFFAIALVYAVAPQLPAIDFPRWGSRASALLLPILAVLSILAVAGTATSRPPTHDVPVDGLEFLRQNAPGGRVYAEQSWGSYMTWSGWPTFFDTRTHQVFPEALIADYHKVERTRGHWIGVLDEWNIGYVMMRPDSDLGEALDGLGWGRVFEGSIEVIWERPDE